MACITIFVNNCGECPCKVKGDRGAYFCPLHNRTFYDLTKCNCKTTLVDHGKVTESTDDGLFPRQKDLP